MAKEPIKGLIILWCILGFVVGVLAGLIWIKIYFENNINDCVEKFNLCKDMYNKVIKGSQKPMFSNMTLYNITVDLKNLKGVTK